MAHVASTWWRPLSGTHTPRGLSANRFALDDVGCKDLPVISWNISWISWMYIPGLSIRDCNWITLLSSLKDCGLLLEHPLSRSPFAKYQLIALSLFFHWQGISVRLLLCEDNCKLHSTWSDISNPQTIPWASSASTNYHDSTVTVNSCVWPVTPCVNLLGCGLAKLNVIGHWQTQDNHYATLCNIITVNVMKRSQMMAQIESPRPCTQPET